MNKLIPVLFCLLASLALSSCGGGGACVQPSIGVPLGQPDKYGRNGDCYEGWSESECLERNRSPTPQYHAGQSCSDLGYTKRCYKSSQASNCYCFNTDTFCPREG